MPIRNSQDLRCTFLAVGHGGAILVELPGGGVLLYDAGSLQNSVRAKLQLPESGSAPCFVTSFTTSTNARKPAGR